MASNQFQYVHPATGCTKCPALASTRHTVVWGSGPAQADIMFIGEAPGQNEDREGLPFVGSAGHQLTQLCREAGIDRREVHIANMLMCRPPGNRDPEPQELENCQPWLVEHVRSVNPKAIVLFGRYAISWLFDKPRVKDTQGLMYISWCDWCGRKLHEGHDYGRLAFDGRWRDSQQIEDASVGALAPHRMQRRLVAAIYHPASILGGRNPEYRPHIVHQLKRLRTELDLLE